VPLTSAAEPTPIARHRVASAPAAPLTGGSYGAAALQRATLSPDFSAQATIVPEISLPPVEIVPQIPAAPIAAPLPATMPAEIRKRRQGLVAGPAARKCLATAIYFEARGEPKRGQAAVAQVILNRVAARGFPSTICGVVYQGSKRKTGCQFSFTCDGIPDRIRERNAWTRAKQIADEVLSGKTRIGELVHATHYHAGYVSPYWAPKMKRLARIGQHIFYNA
jgi:spore germination cell wall hydrolase CwlJ-like protein